MLCIGKKYDFVTIAYNGISIIIYLKTPAVECIFRDPLFWSTFIGTSSTDLSRLVSLKLSSILRLSDFLNLGLGEEEGGTLTCRTQGRLLYICCCYCCCLCCCFCCCCCCYCYCYCCYCLCCCSWCCCFFHLVQVQCGAVRPGESFSCVVERRAGGLGGQGQGGAGLAGGHWHYPAHTGGAGEGAGSVLPLPAHSSWGRVSGHTMWTPCFPSHPLWQWPFLNV